MSFMTRGRAASMFLITVLIAVVVGVGRMVRKQSAPRRAVMQAAARLPVVPGEAIGPVKLGMSEDQVREVLGRPKVLVPRTWTYDEPDMAVMFAKDSPIVVAIFAGGGPLRTRLPWRSAEGIGLGSTREQVKAAWGEPEKENDTHMLYLSRGIDILFGGGKVEWFCVRRFAATRAVE